MLAPVGDADFTYLVGFAPIGDEILVIESAGERQQMDRAKGGIIEAMGRIELAK